MIDFEFDDGGRAAAGFKGSARDCVTRAVAIAAERPYREVYDRLNVGARKQRSGKHGARIGIDTNRKWFWDYMVELGFSWTATMSIGSRPSVHLRADELPTGRLVCMLRRHAVAVVDGVVRDTEDCSRDGSRCVYGIWRKNDD